MVKYKSYGEKAIAEMLAKHNIDFEYEHPTLIRQKYDDDDKERLSIWYPDFWLPKYSIIIEYFGMEGNKQYDKEKKRKLSIYKSMNLDCISVRKIHLGKGLKNYLLNSIKQRIEEKKLHFENRHDEE